MSDLISRQDFDKFLEDAEKEAVKNRKYVFASALNTIRGNLRNFPSAQPERKKGEWEIYVISMLDGEGCRCSECGFEGVPYWDFCPNCDADMREV